VKRAEAEYQRGFTEGRVVGCSEATQEVGRKHYLEGYVACNHAQTVLHNLRNGQIPSDSNEFAFLFDPTHRENLFNLGREIGMLDVKNATSTHVSMVDGSPSRNIATHDIQAKRTDNTGDEQAQEMNYKPADKKRYNGYSEPEPEPVLKFVSPPLCQV
jgi:hypothetical protein